MSIYKSYFDSKIKSDINGKTNLSIDFMDSDGLKFKNTYEGDSFTDITDAFIKDWFEHYKKITDKEKEDKISSKETKRFNDEEVDIETLVEDFNELADKYEELNEEYNRMHHEYNNLSTSFDKLQEAYTITANERDEYAAKAKALRKKIDIFFDSLG